MGKIAKLYRFLRDFPESKSTPWARESLHQLLLEAGEYQRVVALGKQMMAYDPLDLFAAERTLEAARKLADPSVQEWERIVPETARRVVASQIPPTDAGQWAVRLQWAQRIAATLERSEERDRYAAVLSSTGAERIRAVSELLSRFPSTDSAKCPHRPGWRDRRCRLPSR